MKVSILISLPVLLRRGTERERVGEHLTASRGQHTTDGYVIYVIYVKGFHLLLYRTLI